MLFHVGDIADRLSRLQPINQLVFGATLEIFMKIVTNICGAREKFLKNQAELVKFVVVLKK